MRILHLTAHSVFAWAMLPLLVVQITYPRSRLIRLGNSTGSQSSARRQLGYRSIALDTQKGTVVPIHPIEPPPRVIRAADSTLEDVDDGTTDAVVNPTIMKAIPIMAITC